MEKDRDIIRITDVSLTCSQCEKEIEEGNLVNEFVEDGEIFFYCMECVPAIVGTDHTWEAKGE